MTLKNKNTTGVLIFTALMVLVGGFLFFVSQVSAATGINKQINFQGKVVNADGTNVANGNYDFVFKLYSVDTAGTAIWTETRTGGNQVTVTDGVFQVNLGSVTALPGSVDFNTDNIYLGVTFHTDSEMTPRVRFTAVPYAFNADKVHGLTVTDTTGTLTIANGKTVSFADAFSTTGAFPLTLTATASTTATLPTGTITLADLATGQTLTNKTIGSTGLVFSGATTDITTGTGEDLTIVANGSGIISLNDSVTASGAITANGGVSLAGGQSMTAGALSYMDLGSIVHNTTALQGLRLPQAASATPSNPTSGEGYLAWDAAGNQLITYNGSAWAAVGGGGMSVGGSITSATEGSILFAGASGVLAQDNANFFWDDTNNRLGLGDTTPDAVLDVNLTSTNVTAATEYGSTITVADTGIVTTGTDTTYGDYLSFTRTGATGGTINNYGEYISVTGDAGGASTNTGLYVTVTGADTNYAASFQGGPVLIGPGSFYVNSNNSMVVGTSNTISAGSSATAVGRSNTASFDQTVAVGYSNTASSFYSIAMGNGNSATTSNYAIAIGVSNAASGTNSVAIGYDNTVTASGASAFGSGITNGTADSTMIGPNDSAKMTILSSGYVGIGDTTPDSVLDVNFASTSGTAGDEYAQTVTLSDTGAVSSGTDNTYGQYINVARTGATGGTLKTYGTYTTLNSAFTSGSGTAYGYGDYISLTGSTVGNNFLHGSAVYIGGSTDFSYGYYAELTSTGQNIGFESTIVTGGSTSSNQIGFKANVTDGYSAANSFWGAQITTQQTGALSGTETAYGVDISVQNTGSSGATTNTYGGKIAIGTDNAGAGVSTGYGLYVDTSNAGASGVNADTTYALYAMTKANSGTTAYGAYVDAGTGAGTEYSGIFLNGNFGIGDATPAALFTVGASDAFQVNTAGTVSVATGQSYTGVGAVTLSSGGSSGLTIDSASGVTTVATGDYLALSHSGVSGAAAGYFWYDSSDNKFKINENGTTKVLCNTTDAGCGAGGSTSWDTIGDAAAAGAIAMNEYAQTMDWNTASAAAAFDGLTITLTNDAGTDSNTQRAFVVANQDDSAATGTTEAIMQVVNRDANETVGSGLVIENTGAGTMTNAIEILETAGTITTAINIGNGVTTGISIGTGVTTGISIASGGITSTGEVLFTNTGAGLSFRVNDEAADATPLVVDASGNVGIGTTAPSRILDIVQAASAPQLRLSKDLTYYSEFTVDSVGDLQVAAVGGDIRALSENVWVCDNDACPALTLTGEGNIFVENVLKFGNGVYFKNDSATELTVYDNDDQAMLVFDEL